MSGLGKVSTQSVGKYATLQHARLLRVPSCSTPYIKPYTLYVRHLHARTEDPPSGGFQRRPTLLSTSTSFSSTFCPSRERTFSASVKVLPGCRPSTTSAVRNSSASAMVANNGDESVRLQLTTWELFRSWVVLKLCTSERLTTNAEKVPVNFVWSPSFHSLSPPFPLSNPVFFITLEKKV